MSIHVSPAVRFATGAGLPRRQALIRSLLTVLTILLWATGAPAETSTSIVDWSEVARLAPELKILVMLEADRSITLYDLAELADRGLIPADRDPGLVVGKRKAVFTTRIGKYMRPYSLPVGIRTRILERFVMSGIYRTSFKVAEKDYWGPLSFEITAPRDGFGRKLLHSESVVRPKVRSEMRVDSAGNRWFCVSYPKIKTGTTIRFHFSFKYLIDLEKLLAHDLRMVEFPPDLPLPQEALEFLKPGYKIDPRLPPAKAWAAQGVPGNPNPREEYQRLYNFLKNSVSYDQKKRNKYFSGQMVYSDLDEMYQDMTVTLARRVGACPDTSLIECAFLRARGIPCRTAGRFGHFFSMVYVPGHGWMSTSVTPTGIPLILDPGPDHAKYQRWNPKIKLKSGVWEARVRINPDVEAEIEPQTQPVEEANVNEPPGPSALRPGPRW